MTKDFKGKDPLDRTVLFFGSTWDDHVLKQHPETTFSFEDACAVLTDPDHILDNLIGPMRTGRTGKLSYVKSFSTTEGMVVNVMVPAKETVKTENLGGTDVAPGAMLATTAYVVRDVPKNRRRYTKTKR